MDIQTFENKNDNLIKSSIVDIDKRPDLGLFYYSENQIPKFDINFDYWNTLVTKGKYDNPDVQDIFGDVVSSVVSGEYIDRPNVYGFATSVSNWVLWVREEADSSRVDDGDSMGTTITITNSGIYSWSVQFYKNGLSIEDGKAYEIYFDAVVEGIESRKIQVRLQESGTDFNEDDNKWSELFAKDFEITNTLKRYKCTAIASNVTKPSTGQTLNPDVRLNFNIGNFDELAVELGWESSDLWEVCENQHSASQGL